MHESVEPDDGRALAETLLEEWDQGRGTSKSEIERRVWNDGGAHGRRFDRFIRQTLGVPTNRPSKQTDRIGQLETQLRRLGFAPVGTEFDEWEEQLHHGRQAALAALRCWNDPLALFRTQNFSLLFVTAWNSVALALLQRAGEEWRELDAEGQAKQVDGRDRAAETGIIIQAAFPGDRYRGLRRNVEFWCGLRNHVAHRHLAALDAIVIPQAQAGLLNLEGALAERFGQDYVLGEALSVPLQISGFRDAGVLTSAKLLQASLPLDVQGFLAAQADRNADLTDDPSYRLRVTFIPTVPTSGRNPDAVAYFVKPGEVTDELCQALKEFVILPKIMNPPCPNLIASQVVQAVADRTPYKFTMTMHTSASRRLKIRPASDSKDQTATDPQFCEYVSSVKRHLYSQDWVDRLTVELSTDQGFRAATGFEPKPRD